MKRRALVVSVILLLVLGVGIWLSAQMDREPEGKEKSSQPAASVVSRETEWRGAQVRLEIVQEADLEVLAKQWNANLIRVHLGELCGCQVRSEECLRAEGIADLERLDWLLDMCEKYRMRVIIDLVFFPGYTGYAGGAYGEVEDNSLWTRPALQDELVRYWQGIASRYVNRGDVIYGYDLLNEPHGVSASKWMDLAKRITSAIREVDPDHTIIVEGINFAHAKDFGFLTPTGDPNTIYSFHFYRPSEFCFQNWRLPLESYPSDKYDRRYLEDTLRPVVDFMRRYNVRVLAGEFGVRPYAPAESLDAWMTDVLEMFEGHGFDYCYYAYRERAGRSLEHVGRVDTANQTAYGWYEGTSSTLEIFKEYLASNTTNQASREVTTLLGNCVFDTSHWGTGDMPLRAETFDLAWRLGSICTIRQHKQGAITASVLSDTDLLAVGWTDIPLTRDEIRVIQEYVEQGGALLFYCGAVCGGAKQSIDGLLLPFGIRYDPTRLCGEPPAFTAGAFHRFWSYTFNTTHPVGKHGHAFYSYSPASLELSPPAVSIVSTEPNSWADTDWDKKLDSGEQQGPFTIVAASEYGEGRVLVVASSAFNEECNWELLAAGAKWLLGRDDLL